MSDATSNQVILPKSVLLVDVNGRTRDSRAANMRKLGANVDSVPNATMALQRFGMGSYRLVLIDLGRDKEGAEQLARDIRAKQPDQQIGFMVAGPTMIAKTPGGSYKPAIVTKPEAAPTEAAPDGETAFGRAVRDAEQKQQQSEDQ